MGSWIKVEDDSGYSPLTLLVLAGSVPRRQHGRLHSQQLDNSHLGKTSPSKYCPPEGLIQKINDERDLSQWG